MSLEPGGMADKIGNHYESSWITYQLLRLLDEKILYVQVEPLGKDEDAVDVIIGNLDGSRELHQCKIGNRSDEAWTLATLQSKELLKKGFQHILSGSKSYKVVSRIGFRLLEDICDSALNSTGSSSDFLEHQIKNISKERLNLFNELCNRLGLDSSSSDGLDKALHFLKSFQIKRFNEDDLDNDLLVLIAGKIINEPPSHLISFLQSYPVKCDKLRVYITTDLLLKDLENTQFTFKNEFLEKNNSVSLNHLARFVSENNSYYFVTGTKQKISIKQLLPMHLEKISFNFDNYKNDVSTALSNYYKTTEREKNYLKNDYFDSLWIGRFVKQIVIVAGPGLGKSTMMKELAHEYANENFLVLKVELKKIAISLKNGETFDNAIFKIGLDGSGLIFNNIKDIDKNKWIILADGLDECSDMHEEVSSQIKKFSVGHTNVRIIITTRPIGYNTVEFESWTHYRLLPPIKDECFSNLAHLMKVIYKDDISKREIEDGIKKKLHRSYDLNAISNSPQLLCMATLLIRNNHSLPEKKEDLYKELFELYKISPKFNKSKKQETYELIINIIGFKLIENPLINFDMLIRQCAEHLMKYIIKTRFECDELVREAVINWEKVGLIEQINYQQSSIITFTHKTFSEFLAARYLCETNDANLFEQLVDKPEWSEVINFAIAMNLADNFIRLKIDQYQSGKTNSLQTALELLKKHSITNSIAKELVNHAMLSIENNSTEKFSIGLVLSDLVSGKIDVNIDIINELILEVRSKLDIKNIDTLLIFWAITIECYLENYDVKFITNTFDTIAENINIPSVNESIVNIIKKVDTSNLKLFQRIALATLMKQPDEEIETFYNTKLKDKNIFKSTFRVRVDILLESKGISVEKNDLLGRNNFLNKNITNSVSPIPRSEKLSSFVKPFIYAISEAIIDTYVNDSKINQEQKMLPQFSGLLKASNFWDIPLSDASNWEKDYNKKEFSTTIKAIIKIFPIDYSAMKNEARDIIKSLNQVPNLNLYDLLPNVDMPMVEWSKLNISEIEKEDIKNTLFHSSQYASLMAYCLLLDVYLSKDELLVLLDKSSGFSCKLIIFLIQQHYNESLWEMLSNYLDTHPIVDLYYFFNAIKLLNIEPPSVFIEKIVTSDNEAVLAYRNEILEHWIENEIIIKDSNIN